MRPQYFRHRAIFDFNKQTNDVGFPLPWQKGNEDNHFLFRLYKKEKQEYEPLYQHHLSFFLNKYSDATEQEFYNHVQLIITDAIEALVTKDRYTSKHAQERRNRLQLQEFLQYLESIDQWFVRSTDQETISRQQEEIAKLVKKNKQLADENKKLRELEPKDYIDIPGGAERVLYHLFVQIRDLKLEDGKFLTHATTLNIWCKMIARYFKVDGEDINWESLKRFFGPENFEEYNKYTNIPQKDQRFKIVPAKKRSI